ASFDGEFIFCICALSPISHTLFEAVSPTIPLLSPLSRCLSLPPAAPFHGAEKNESFGKYCTIDPLQIYIVC
ncbi:MAG: hypothetical protein IJA58_09210, partial [Lachnospiraceae bacterium]|nr:hypothetical protein [Lachnospiraceae bacterium]